MIQAFLNPTVISRGFTIRSTGVTAVTAKHQWPVALRGEWRLVIE